MARPAPSEPDEDVIVVPKSVRFPVELTPPDGFDPARLETWPRVEGSLEWVAGRLLFMPPCGGLQQETVADLVTTLGVWARQHPDFVVGTNEAGMLLGDDVRGADAAVWRREQVGRATNQVRRVAPLLAAEVAGRDEREPQLRDKAGWYLARGVAVVWLLFPREREVVVVGERGESRYARGARLPEDAVLPGLAPSVDDLFRQLD